MALYRGLNSYHYVEEIEARKEKFSVMGTILLLSLVIAVINAFVA